MTPGETIKTEREKRGWSQTTLADRTQLSTSAINRYERNKRALTIEAAHVLATTLAEDTDDYRRLSANLVKSTCDHFGTCRRKRLPLEGDHGENGKQNAATNKEGNT